MAWRGECKWLGVEWRGDGDARTPERAVWIAASVPAAAAAIRARTEWTGARASDSVTASQRPRASQR